MIGWLSVFFPYDKEGNKRNLRWDVPKPLPWPPGSDEPVHDPDEAKNQPADYEYSFRIYNEAIPAGMSSGPVRVEHKTCGTHRVRLIGGFVGVEQKKHTFTLKPIVSWCIALCPETKGNDASCERKPAEKRPASPPSHHW